MFAFRLLLLLMSLIGEIGPDGKEIEGDPPAPDKDKDKDKDKKPEIPPDVQEYFNGIIAAEKRRAKDDAKAEFDAAKAAADQKAADDKKVSDEEAKSNYEAAKLLIEKERDDAKGSLTTVTAERDRLLGMIKSDVEATWKDLPAEVVEMYDGEDTDLLAKKDFMTKMEKVIVKLTGSKDKKRGHVEDPDPSGPIKDGDKVAVLAKNKLFG